MYLVDTNVISAAAPSAAVKRAELIEWMDAHSSALFLSAITVAEIAEGGCLFNFFRKLVNQLVFERNNFFLQFSFDLIGHGITARLEDIIRRAHARRSAPGFRFLTLRIAREGRRASHGPPHCA